MEDITDLQHRIAGALDRIGAGLDHLSHPAPPAASSTETEDDTALAAERRRTGEVEEELRESRDRCVAVESRAADLEAELAQARAQIAALEEDRDALRDANAQLRESSEKLRHTTLDGAAAAELVNGALTAEIEALRAARASDRAELDAIVGLLGAAIAPQGDTEDEDDA